MEGAGLRRSWLLPSSALVVALAAACSAVEPSTRLRSDMAMISQPAREPADTSVAPSTQLNPTLGAGVGGVGPANSAGGHSCAVTTSREVWCWGNNENGQLGDGTRATSPDPNAIYFLPPVKAFGLSDAVAVSLGVRNTCALTGSGSVYCWGSGSSDFFGGLQVPVYPPRYGGGSAWSQMVVPVRIPNIDGAIQLSTNGRSTCVLTNIGVVKCWGSRENGILGDGPDVNYRNPSPVPRSVPEAMQGLPPMRSISIGSSFGCGVSITAEVWCWGSNRFGGGIGDGRQIADAPRGVIVPASLPTRLTGIESATEIALGADYACARDAPGSLWCWGHDVTEGYSTPAGQSPAPPVIYPKQVNPPAAVEHLTSGLQHVCFTVADATVECFGDRQNFQLGDGRWFVAPPFPPVKVSIGPSAEDPQVNLPLNGAASVTAGASHSCARLADGSVYCWGSNGLGQLGDGLAGGLDVSNKFAVRVVGLPLAAPSAPLPQVDAVCQEPAPEGDNTGDCKVRVAVLGDSYISGEGANQMSRYQGCTDVYRLDCDRNQDNQLTAADVAVNPGDERYQGWAGAPALRDQPGYSGNNCHRSPDSWAWNVAQNVATGPANDNILFAACSGATTEELVSTSQYSDSPDWLPGGRPQIDSLAAAGEVDHVFVSIGGNDFGFVDLIKACYGVGDCSDSGGVWLDRVRERRPQIVAALERIREAAPDATVWMINYPQVVGRSVSRCPQLSGDEQDWLATSFLPAVNEAVHQSAMQAGVRTIDAAGSGQGADVELGNVFEGHEVCTRSAWVNGLSASQVPVLVGNADDWLVEPASFHPNSAGHAAIAASLRSELVEPGLLGVGNPSPVDQGIGEVGLPSAVASFELSPVGLQQGGPFYASLREAPPDREFSVTFESNPIDLGTIRTDAQGRWSGLLNLPSPLPTGVHRVRIRDAVTGEMVIDRIVLLGSRPTTTPDTASTSSGQAVVIDVLTNDEDPDEASSELQVRSVSVDVGTAEILGQGVKYSPPAGFVGRASGNYEVCDIAEPCAVGSFTVDVTPRSSESQHVEFQTTGRRVWAGATELSSSPVRVVRDAAGRPISLTGTAVIASGDTDYRIDADVSTFLFWTFGSLKVTDTGTGKEVTGLVLFGAPLVEASGRLQVTARGLQFYRGQATVSSVELRVSTTTGG